MEQGSYPHFFRRSLRHRWVVVVVALLLGVASGMLLLQTTTSEYRATSVVFLEPVVGNPYSPTTPDGRQEELAALTTEAGLLLSDSVSTAAQESALRDGVDLGPRIQERTSTEVPSNSQVIHVSFTATTPEVAQIGAQALATSYLDYRESRSQQVISAQLARIDQELASLSSLVETASQELSQASALETAAGNADIQSLEEQVRIYANQLAQLRIERVNAEGGSASPGEIVSPARLPDQPEGLPPPALATAIALVLLGAGIVAAVVLEHLDTRLHSRDQIERLGLHPVHGPAMVWHPELIGSEREEPYRLAVMAWQSGVHAVLGADRPVPVGVAAGLAHALADSGRSVLVVMSMGTPGGADQGVGLSDALHGHEQLPEMAFVEARPGVRVIDAGQHAEDLPSLLQGARFPALVADLSHHSDIVLLVGAEAGLASGAALALVSQTTLLVCNRGQTPDEDLMSAAGMVRDHEGQLGGVLLIAKPRRNQPGSNLTTVVGADGLIELLTSETSDGSEHTDTDNGATSAPREHAPQDSTP